MCRPRGPDRPSGPTQPVHLHRDCKFPEASLTMVHGSRLCRHILQTSPPPPPFPGPHSRLASCANSQLLSAYSFGACSIHGMLVTLQVTMVAGKASRVAYRPLTPDPEHPKALLLPFAAQLHITVARHDPAWQYLLVRTKPPGLLRKSNYLWPSNSQASACSTCLGQT